MGCVLFLAVLINVFLSQLDKVKDKFKDEVEEFIDVPNTDSKKEIDLIDVLNPDSKKEIAALGDANMKQLKRGDILQLVRKGYFICDVPYTEPSKPIVLYAIPDGKLHPSKHDIRLIVLCS